MTAVECRSGVDLEKLLSGAQLPALPQSAIRLLELSSDLANGPAQFAVPIEADPGLTGQVLRFVNSSYFGFSRKISSVKLAISLVGIRTIKNFALWSAVFSLMPNPRCGPFELKCLWQDSLRRALFARTAAKWLGLKDGEDVFSAALLQDMAIPLLAKAAPDIYAQLLRVRSHDKTRLSALERPRFGWTHAEVGARMARKWNLPDAFARLIENHCSLGAGPEHPARATDARTVALSSLLPSTADNDWADRGAMDGCFQAVMPKGAPSLGAVFGQVDTEFAEFAPILKIARPSKSLRQILDEAAVATAQMG